MFSIFYAIKSYILLVRSWIWLDHDLTYPKPYRAIYGFGLTQALLYCFVSAKFGVAHPFLKVKSLFFAVKSSHNLVNQVVTYHDLDRNLIHTVLLECRSASLSRALFTTLYVAGPFSNAEYLSVLAFCDSTAFNDSSINFSISHVTSSPKTIELNMIVIWSVYLLSTAAIYRVSSKYLPLEYDVR